MTLAEKEFERLGKEILEHKYLYYIKANPTITDYDYDMLEVKYTKIAKSLEKEPGIHLINDWEHLEELNQACVIDFPAKHPWAKEILDKYGDTIYNEEKTEKE